MYQLIWKPTVLAMAAISLIVMVPLPVSAQNHPQDQQDQKADEHHDGDKPDDKVAQYRHDHPKAAARCHDGFFTTTKDRKRACSKHGGIDVWLAP